MFLVRFLTLVLCVFSHCAIVLHFCKCCSRRGQTAKSHHFLSNKSLCFIISFKLCLEMERLVLQYLHKEIEEIIENGFAKGLFRRVPIASICCPVQ